jgi:hypothetical protein
LEKRVVELRVVFEAIEAQLDQVCEFGRAFDG